MPKKDDLIAARQKFYSPIPGDEEGRELKIDTAFSTSGVNYFTYERQSQGYFVHFSPVKREGRAESFVLFGNGSFKMCALQANRFSAKAWTELQTFVAENIETLRELYLAGDRDRLAAFLRDRTLPAVAEESEALPAAA